jgi:tetratricopeptide (TPR) repeat protein
MLLAVCILAGSAPVSLPLAARSPAESVIAEAPAQPAASHSAILDPFEAASPIQADRLRGLRPEIARTILRDRPGGEIALAVLPYPVPVAADKTRVALFIEIDGASFLDSNQSRIAQVEIYAYALTTTGSVAGYLAEAFTLDVVRHGEAIWSGGLRFVGWLELPAGGYELRVMVHNAHSLARGLVLAQLDVSTPAVDAPTLLPPLFTGSRVRDSWLAIRGRAGWLPAGAESYPFVAGGLALLPAARPVLVSGRRTTAHLMAERLPREVSGGWLELLEDSTVVAAEPRRIVVARAPLEIGKGESGPNRLASLPVGFIAPTAAPGRYDLRLALDSPSGQVVSPTLAVLLVDAGPQDRELMWSDLKALQATAPVDETGAEGGSAPTAARAPRARQGRGVRRLTARYREALAESAGAAEWPAEIFDLELEVLGRGGEDSILRLRTAELLAASELANRQVTLLLPLISLHDELFHLYRRRHLYSLVSHTRRLLESLAELHATLGGSPETTAEILASVGGYMQELRAPYDSRRLFERALEHDPDSPAALLGLALSHEKYGEYRQAVERLEPLVAARPDLDEARLRLALNLERVGDRQRFRELLASLVAGTGTGWVSALACQELARSFLETGSLEEAAAVLKEALEHMPDRQALRILLAHVYDRQGRLTRSWESLEQVAASGTTGGGSERLVYDEWANGPMDRARQAVKEDADRARESLLSVLAPVEPPER